MVFTLFIGCDKIENRFENIKKYEVRRLQIV